MSTEMSGRSPDAFVGPDWLGLQQHDVGRYSFELVPTLSRFDGQLYGGAGLAASVALVGLATERDPLWVTTQFVGAAHLGEWLDCHVEVLAHGGGSSQLRLTATVGDRIIFTALGAAGRDRPDGFTAEFGRLPAVDPPEDCPRWALFESMPANLLPANVASFGPLGLAEMRQAARHGDSTLLWMRMRQEAQTPETIAYLADFVPSQVLRAAGRIGGGTSLDNSIRFGPPPTSPWILIEVDPYFGHSGYVHGGARIWTPDGRLTAVASQTARARLFDGGARDPVHTQPKE